MSSYGQSYGENALPHSRSQTPVADISRTASYASQRPDTSGTTGAQSIKSTGEYRTDTDAKSLTGSTKDGDANVSRQPSTLKKRNSVKRSSSLRRSGSRSRRSTVGEMDSENLNSAFYSPIPSHGNPTEILANRFNGWRRILKDFIAYFKEVQVSYEGRAKNTSRLFHTLNSAIEPEMFLRSGGILETNVVLKEYHKSAMLASEQAKQVELQIISSLSGLRNDLSSKIKEIKQLAGDFKNNLDKEREGTRRAVTQLADALSAVDTNPSLASGKNDPFIVKLAVDKQLKRQIAEENYLHRAYLNLESSGRELESIVVSEIQKAFESYMNILRMEGAELTDTAERLQTQTLNLPADHEWSSFIERDSNFVDPNRPVRNFDNIEYPGWNHPAGVEVRAGVLERKSKYLKSYTPGWYVLSPSHLHEFKTPDRMHDMTPVMSLYLPDCTMGSHTPLGAKSHKFMIKGRQTGAMHRGHSWVFRAESHEVMLGFFQDIQKLVELSGAERNAFVAQHQKQHAPAPMDGNATKEAGSSGSENGLENDEADEIPYSADRSALVGSEPSIHEFRPEGGRFPSDIDIQRRRSMRSNASGARSATSVESDRSIHAEPVVVPISQIQEPTGYRGEDERPLNGYDDERFEYFARGRPGMGERNASTFSYDAKHPPASTAYEGEDFQPVRSNVPPEIERKMSKQTDPAELAATSIISPERRESTSSWTRTTPSRKPTATYGVDPVTGQPDPSASLVSAQPGVLQNQQPIAMRNVNENTTSSLASYEASAAAGGAGAGAYELYRAQADQRHAAVTQEAVPRGATSLDYETFTTGAPSAAPSNTANIHTVPSLTDVAFVPAASTPTEEPVKPTKSYGDLTTEPVQELAPPPAHRTNSNFTISDLHVPGGYPKQ